MAGRRAGPHFSKEKKNVANITDFKAGDKVELAQKGTMFADPATGFNVTGEEKKELTAPIGKATGRALVSGALLVVGTKAAKAAVKKADAEETK